MDKGEVAVMRNFLIDLEAKTKGLLIPLDFRRSTNLVEGYRSVTLQAENPNPIITIFGVKDIPSFKTGMVGYLNSLRAYCDKAEKIVEELAEE